MEVVRSALRTGRLYPAAYTPGGVRGGAVWLRHCATSLKVAGSIPDNVTEIFHSHNPSGRTMALGLTQPLREMSIPKRILEWEPIGTKIRGRPRTRWIVDIEEDMQIFGIRRWIKQCEERAEWKRITEKAKTHSGL